MFFLLSRLQPDVCILWRLQPMWRPERWWNEKSSLRRLSYVHQQLFLFLPLCVMTHRLSPCNDNSCSWPSGHSVETGNQTFKYYCMYVCFHCHQGRIQEKKTTNVWKAPFVLLTAEWAQHAATECSWYLIYIITNFWPSLHVCISFCISMCFMWNEGCVDGFNFQYIPVLVALDRHTHRTHTWNSNLTTLKKWSASVESSL